jgi:hypothetical protein
MQTDRQSDKTDIKKLKVAFRNFANETEMKYTELLLFEQYISFENYQFY